MTCTWSWKNKTYCIEVADVLKLTCREYQSFLKYKALGRRRPLCAPQVSGLQSPGPAPPLLSAFLESCKGPDKDHRQEDALYI